MGKHALISGGGSGIGLAIAAKLSGLGYRVALLGRDRAKLEKAAAGLSAKASEPPLFESCDVADRASVQKAVSRVLGEFGSIDVLVCNAGVNVKNRSLATLTPEDWDLQIATNLTGAFNVVYHVLPSMRERKSGWIIQVCSVSGIRASVLGGTAYSASKFGQSALGICIGREERVNGIRSSVIYPGEVETPILENRPVAVGAERRSQILQPEDIAAAVGFLVALPPRATVPELVITPAVDDFG